MRSDGLYVLPNFGQFPSSSWWYICPVIAITQISLVMGNYSIKSPEREGSWCLSFLSPLGEVETVAWVSVSASWSLTFPQVGCPESKGEHWEWTNSFCSHSKLGPLTQSVSLKSWYFCSLIDSFVLLLGSVLKLKFLRKTDMITIVRKILGQGEWSLVWGKKICVSVCASNASQCSEEECRAEDPRFPLWPIHPLN